MKEQNVGGVCGRIEREEREGGRDVIIISKKIARL